MRPAHKLERILLKNVSKNVPVCRQLSCLKLLYMKNVNRQTRVFEVFNVKVKLLHDSSYQTISQQLLLFLVVANAISSLCNYRRGGSRSRASPVRKENKEDENNNNTFFPLFFFPQVQI